MAPLDESLLSDLKTLQALVPLATTIGTAASNPQAWLEDFIREVIAEWVVGGILDATSYVFGWLIFAYERTSSIILDAAGPLASPFRIVEDAVVAGIESLYDAALGVAHAAGLAGPPAAAFAIALISLVLAAVIYATWRSIPGSDAFGGALEAIR